MELRTERLLLRPVRKKDVEDVFDYSRDPEVGPNAGWKPHESKQETLEVMKEIFLHRENTFGMEYNGNHKLIGTIGLIDDPKRTYVKAMTIGYAMHRDYWGMGLMTEAVRAMLWYAFDGLHVRLISAYCYPHNVRSQRVLEKNHFEQEGIIHCAECLYDGSVLDNLCYYLMREDYVNLRLTGEL